MIDDKLNEDTVAGDVAQVACKIGTTCRGLPAFEIEDSHEFHSFQKGIKSFHRWKKHSKSEEIRQYARKNPGKDFYVHHAGNYMKIRRGKQRDVVESCNFNEETQNENN